MGFRVYSPTMDGESRRASVSISCLEMVSGQDRRVPKEVILVMVTLCGEIDQN